MSDSLIACSSEPLLEKSSSSTEVASSGQKVERKRMSFASGLICSMWAGICFFSVWIPAYVCSFISYKISSFFGFDKKRYFTSSIMRNSNTLAVMLNPFWSIKSILSDRTPRKERALIYVCNHQSNMDPIALNTVMPTHVKWVAKDSIFNVPLGKC